MNWQRGDVQSHSSFVRDAAALGVTVVAGEPLARHTTFRIGGPADLYAAVHDIELLERLAALSTAHGIPLTVLGGGSNMLVSDAGIRGLVIANQTRDFGFETNVPGSANAQDLQLVADSGVTLAGLARWAIRAGWSGLEWAVSIPGTVGGAVVGNAGAHGGQIADNLAWVLVTYPARAHLHLRRSAAQVQVCSTGASRQAQQVLAAEQMEFTYRASALKCQVACGETPAIILRAGFRLVPGDAGRMTTRADAFLASRRASQPVEPSAGSIFRNPLGDHAGRLIEAVGLKGHCVGGAQISRRHANFIVNNGDARASDVLGLMNLARTRVYESTGIELVPEILFLGEWAEQPPYALIGEM